MPSNCIVGATRWDAWYFEVTDSPAVQTARALSPASYRSRAPKHALVANNRVRFSGVTGDVQAAIDAECIAAEAGALDYWAFLMYGGAATGYIRPDLNEPMMAGLKAYRTSPEKNRVKWCLMQQGDLMGTTGNYAGAVTEMVGWMLESNYQRVLTNRPLMYIYGLGGGITSRWAGSTANFKVMLDAVRAGVISGGAGDPYIVSMDGTSTANAIAVGCNAITSYIGTIPTGVPSSYATLDTTTRAYWATLAATGQKVVPIAMCGWNQAPRQERPQTWNAATARPYIKIDGNVTLPTNAELTTHFQAAVDYVNTGNPTACESKAILAYAWNEHDEGGWLAPTIGDPTGTRLAAIAPVIA